VMARLEKNSGVVADMGFSDYFSWCGTLIRHARERASASDRAGGLLAGCCIAYCLRIVDLDPLATD